MNRKSGDTFGLISSTFTVVKKNLRDSYNLESLPLEIKKHGDWINHDYSYSPVAIWRVFYAAKKSKENSGTWKADYPKINFEASHPGPTVCRVTAWIIPLEHIVDYWFLNLMQFQTISDFLFKYKI